MKLFKKLDLARNPDPKKNGYMTMSLLVADGKVSKDGDYVKGEIIAQFYGESVDRAEKIAEYFLNLYENNDQYEDKINHMSIKIEELQHKFNIAAESLNKIESSIKWNY